MNAIFAFSARQCVSKSIIRNTKSSKSFQFLNQLTRFNSSQQRSLHCEGIYPPITTPFDESENINYAKLKTNLEKWEKIDFRGYVVLGSNGEFPYLSESEKIDLVKFVKENANSAKQVIAGSGCETTRGTCELSNKFASVGVDAVLVITPSFYKGRMTQSALYDYYITVADSVKAPVILYNVPANTGVDLPLETTLSLADHPNIVGIKDSSGDIPKLYRLVAETKGKNFQVLSGSAGFLLPSLHAANCHGEEVVNLYKLFKSGLLENQKEAQSLQARMVLPNAVVTRKFGVPALKHIMDKVGLFGGPTRSPLKPCTKTEIEELETIFRKYGFLQ